MGLYDKPESLKPLHWFWIIGLGVIYAFYTGFSWSTGYIDFGDGNYMYISWRIAQGAVVYRDILAPQPPCHLFLGALIVKFGDLLASLAKGLHLGSPAVFETLTLYLFRGFSVLLHLATYALLLRLAWRAWGRPFTTVLAGAIWLWLPIGFWWSLGYQSEPLEIFFLLAMMLAALRGDFTGDLLAGVCAALAGLTNATAAPFLLVLILYMLVRAPLRALRMSAVCVILAGVTVWSLQVWTEGAFLQNTVFNQVGTFPGHTVAEFLDYAIPKISREGLGVIDLEVMFVVLALLGFWRFLATSPLDSVSCGGLGWFFLATLGSLVYVSKGGTENYIFSLSEPAVAILAAGELAAWGRRWTTPLPEVRSGWIVRTVPFWLAKSVATLLLALFALEPGLYYHYLLHTQAKYELKDVSADRIVRQIKRLSPPDQPLLAPPFYAFRAQRRLWGDYCELFIWQRKYWQDREDKNPRGEGWLKTQQMARAIFEKRLPIVVLELDQQGGIPEVQAALQAAYVPLPSPLATSREVGVFIAPTLNTRLGFFVPQAGQTPRELADQKQKWAAFKEDLEGHYGALGARQKFSAWYAPQAGPGAAAPAAAPPEAARFTPVLKARPAPTTSTLTRGESTPTTPSAQSLTRAPAAPTTPSLHSAPATPAPERHPAAPAGGTPTTHSLGRNENLAAPGPDTQPTTSTLNVHPALPAGSRTSQTLNSQQTTRTLRRRPSYEIQPRDIQPMRNRQAPPGQDPLQVLV